MSEQTNYTEEQGKEVSSTEEETVPAAGTTGASTPVDQSSEQVSGEHAASDEAPSEPVSGQTFQGDTPLDPSHELPPAEDGPIMDPSHELPPPPPLQESAIVAESAAAAQAQAETAPEETPAVAHEPAAEAAQEHTTETAQPVEGAQEAAPHETAPQGVASSETAPSEAASQEAAPQEPPKPQYNIDELYPDIIAAKNNNTTIDVEGIRRVRGGVLVEYKHMPMFLPTSHLSLKSNPSENDLLSLIHKTFPVHIHELSEDDKSRVIVSRRKLLRQELMDQFQIGQTVEGRVSSITDFGAFVDIGGVDGMVHVSRISRRRINHPSDALKKGDTIKALIKDIDRNTERISLSMKELEEVAPAPSWESTASEFPVGSHHKGVVRGITDFGAYVQLKPGVDGLVHISEMSWARRIKHPSELLKEGQEVEVEVLGVSDEKKKISLGYKQTQPNPWGQMAERFPLGTEVSATVKEVLPRGVVVNLADDVDAFLPKGKMNPAIRNNKAPFNVGDPVQVIVMDVVPENHSLIVGMEGFDQRAGGGYDRDFNQGQGGQGQQGGGRSRGGQRGGGNRDRDYDRPRNDRDRGDRGGNPTQAMGSSSQNVTLLDLLSEEEKRKLFGGAAPESETEEQKPE